MISSSPIYRKFIWSGVILVIILIIGTLGYWFIGGRQYSFLDTLYMTLITISTIGFGEIVDLSGNPIGRIFTILVAISGIGVLLYVVTNLTALVVEGELSETFRRRRVEKAAQNSKEHYIVCGLGSVGSNIVSELQATMRAYVIVDTNKSNAKRHLESAHDEVLIDGDATEDDTLIKAGIMTARGLFAVTGDDNQNIVISLTAKQLNPHLRVVAQCNETRNSNKIRKAGADAVVSPTFIGGLRMASEMIRPTAVSFLDIMLRDRDKSLRVEEATVPDEFIGKTISALKLKECHNTLLLAIKVKDDWVYNPPDNYILQHENTLIFMTTPEGRCEIEGFLHISK